jgi:chromosome partitioning protein
MAITIAISNHKGGVGKTTTVVNLGAALGQMGYRVLMIDLDPQANMTQSLGFEERDKSIYAAIRGDIKLADATEWYTDKVSIVPSEIDLSGADVDLVRMNDREQILRKLIKPIADKYDYILIDCSPSIGLLTVNAFVAANTVVLPLQPEFLAFKGLTKLVDVIDRVRDNLNKNLYIGGVFITQYDNRKVLNRNVKEAIEANFESILFKTVVRDNIALAEAPATGKDIFNYAPRSFGAEDYLNLAREVVQRFRPDAA